MPSRTVIVHPVLAAILAAVIVLILGAASTPRDSQGRPLLLLPGTRSVEGYQRAAQVWIRDLQLLDADLSALSQTNPPDVLTQSSQAQQALERAVQTGKAIGSREPPPELAGLAGGLHQAAQDYQDAAGAASEALSVPDASHRQGAQEALAKARQDLAALEKSPWLTSER